MELKNKISAPPLRLGVIGCGNVLGAYQPAIEALSRRGKVAWAAACGRETQRRFVVEELRVPHFTSDFRELVRSREVDLVLVLTPMKEHGQMARAALEAGKHVLVEKPLATTLEEAARLVELARQNPGLLLPAPFTLLSPTFQTIARRIQQGDIGKVHSARALYGWAGPWWSEWFYRPGGGCLFDLGVYQLTSLTGLLGPARRVMAMAGVAIPEREINGRKIRVEAEDNAHVLLDFGGSVFAAVTAGFTIQQYRRPAIEIYGGEGTLQLLGDDWDPDGYELWQNQAGAWQLYKETHPDWPWTDGLRHLVECIERGERPLITPEHAYHVLEIMIQAHNSARQGLALEIKSAFTPPRFAPPAPAESAHLIHDRTRQ